MRVHEGRWALSQVPEVLCISSTPFETAAGSLSNRYVSVTCFAASADDAPEGEEGLLAAEAAHARTAAGSLSIPYASAGPTLEGRSARASRSWTCGTVSTGSLESNKGEGEGEGKGKGRWCGTPFRSKWCLRR